MKRIKLIGFAVVLLLSTVLLGGKPVLAAASPDDADRVQKATDVLTEIMSIPEGSIPEELMERARGIAVIPHVVKGAFGIGGSYGKGLVSQRRPDGRWSPPAFIQIGGGSFGFQIGVEATDVVLVFTNADGIKSLLNGKLTLGADASVAAGPVGRHAAAGTDIKLNSSIYSYSRSKGLFAGVALSGAVITIDEDANGKVYGDNVDAREILFSHNVKPNAMVAPFVDALNKYSRARMSR